MKRICQYCGVEFDGDPGSISCPACAQDHKKSTLRARTCRQCGTVFAGGPRAWYCPSCRGERKKETDRSYKKRGPVRPLGSIDRCIVCGKGFVVNSSRQRYCKDCAAEEIKKRDRESSLKYYYDNIDSEERRTVRQLSSAPIKCEWCGKLFIPTTRAVTCSPECSLARHLKMMREYDAERKLRTMNKIDLYNLCVSESFNYTDRDAFVSDMALSSVWEDDLDAEMPQDRIDWLSNIWDASHRDIKSIAKAAGMSQRALARRFCIPIRTMEEWGRGKNGCALHIRLMMQECLGLVKPEP